MNKEGQIGVGILLVLLLLVCNGCAQRTSTAGGLATELRPDDTETQEMDEAMGGDVDASFDDEFDDFEEFDEEFSDTLPTAYDPLEKWNRGVFAFNDKAYNWVLRPATRGYRAVTPEPVRTGTRNFFDNLAMPVRAINCLLQGKVRAAGMEVLRFGVNSTVGMFGCADPAADAFGWQAQDEDLGQTFGVWGVAEGPYLVWPFMGPSNARDSVARAGDYFLKPLSYIDAWEAELVLKGVEYTNLASFSIEQYDLIKEEALEPYVAIRTGYLQYRRKMIQE